MGLGKDSLNMTQKLHTLKEKVDNFNFSKIKNCQNTLNKLQKQATEWQMYLQIM